MPVCGDASGAQEACMMVARSGGGMEPILMRAMLFSCQIRLENNSV